MLTAIISRQQRMLTLLRTKQRFEGIISSFSTEQNVSLDSSNNTKQNENIYESILFNSVVENRKPKLGWHRNRGRERKIEQLEKREKENTRQRQSTMPTSSVAFKYLDDEYKAELLKKVEQIDNVKPPETTGTKEIPVEIEQKYIESIENNRESNSWAEDLEDEEVIDPMQIGSADPNIKQSHTPCGGCGAMLHCQDHNVPGFLPKELFYGVPEKHLRSMICQRCHFFKHYSTALDVNVSPDEYPKILGQIQKQRALVLIVVDLMDFPCSIWPQLSDVIGTNRPVCIIGNKVDLLPQDSKEYLSRVSDILKSEVQKATGLSDKNIKHVALVSAKTGYGIEQLINQINNSWAYKGDIYLVGCTNVGKSSLFNALLSSDLCKVKAVDLVQRATISPWPGTTLNLLKFPMLRPEAWRMHFRTRRLIEERKTVQAEEELRKAMLKKTRKLEYATLSGYIGRTFRSPVEEKLDSFSMNFTPAFDFTPDFGINPKDPDFKESRWCYDTPGTIQNDQVLNLLTEEELELTLPAKIISPHTFNIRPGQSLFIAGLGRLDYIDGYKHVMFTVFTSSQLPLTICWTKEASNVYSHLLGSELLAVPQGDEERLSDWPGLTPGPEFTLKGKGWEESCADVVLSSAGWVAITLGSNYTCTLQAHTPDARGIYIRDSALLPFAVNRRGTRIKHSLAFGRFRPWLQ